MSNSTNFNPFRLPTHNLPFQSEPSPPQSEPTPLGQMGSVIILNSQSKSTQLDKLRGKLDAEEKKLQERKKKLDDMRIALEIGESTQKVRWDRLRAEDAYLDKGFRKLQAQDRGLLAKAQGLSNKSNAINEVVQKIAIWEHRQAEKQQENERRLALREEILSKTEERLAATEKRQIEILQILHERELLIAERIEAQNQKEIIHFPRSQIELFPQASIEQNEETPFWGFEDSFFSDPFISTHDETMRSPKKKRPPDTIETRPVKKSRLVKQKVQ